MAGQIRWKQKDYLTLGRAVKEFNTKIDKLNAEEQKLYLPEKISYKEAKEKILTRNELNRVISSLRRFNEPGAEELYITKAGEQITKWERGELGREIRTAKATIKKELSKLEQPFSSGYSKAQMGSQVYQELLNQLRYIQEIEEKRGQAFGILKNKINILGSKDYEMLKATIYKENFLNALESSSNLDGYDLLMKRLNRIKNPENFFNFIEKSNVFTDIFEYYKEGEGLIYGNFSSEQDRFNYGLEELGIVDDEKERLIKKVTKMEDSNLLSKVKSIAGAEDLFEVMRILGEI